MKFLLNNAQSSSHRVEIDPQTRQVILTKTIKFDVTLVQASLDALEGKTERLITEE